MNAKNLKKTVKRIKAKKRALSQTARRRTRLIARKNKGQTAPDIYRTKKGAKGRSAGDRSGDRTMKKYGYNMFEYGDPLAAKAKPAAASRRKPTRTRSQGGGKMGQRLRNTPKHNGVI